mmetsp:Transcript_77694/g.130422  ORF Transcript_77694/g.130422 Transcript_77694/m.130422 type:complete len:87 (-) Transcript_77694:289-549(-)
MPSDGSITAQQTQDRLSMKGIGGLLGVPSLAAPAHRAQGQTPLNRNFEWCSQNPGGFPAFLIASSYINSSEVGKPCRFCCWSNIIF